MSNEQWTINIEQWTTNNEKWKIYKEQKIMEENNKQLPMYIEQLVKSNPPRTMNKEQRSINH